MVLKKICLFTKQIPFNLLPTTFALSTLTLLTLSSTSCFSTNAPLHLKDCYFNSDLSTPCTFSLFNKPASIQIQGVKQSNEEVLLKTVLIQINETKQELSLSEATIMFTGDTGYMIFDDINFDGFPDLGISTSFGIANHYFDYWVFNVEEKKFNKIGNYPRFTLHPEQKTLSYSVKINAAEYQEKSYQWRDGSLKELENH